MNKYFCPYCNPKYQFSKENISGKLICGLCGEDLIEKKLINLKQVISLIVVVAFTLPFVYILIFSLFNQNQYQRKNRQVSHFYLQKEEYPKLNKSAST